MHHEIPSFLAEKREDSSLLQVCIRVSQWDFGLGFSVLVFGLVLVGLFVFKLVVSKKHFKPRIQPTETSIFKQMNLILDMDSWILPYTSWLKKYKWVH